MYEGQCNSEMVPLMIRSQVWRLLLLFTTKHVKATGKKRAYGDNIEANHTTITNHTPKTVRN